ncbi:MAG: hypothetical protein ACLFST_15720 [Spirochaetia bacterium]
MILYSLFASPIILLTITALFGSAAVVKQVFVSFGKGLLAFFPVYAVILVIRRIISAPFDSPLLYFDVLFTDFLFPLIFAGLLFMLLSYRQMNDTKQNQVFVTAAFLSGFYTLYGLAELLQLGGIYDAYILFYRPTLWVGIIIFLPICIQGIFSEYGTRKLIYAGLLLLQLLLFTFIPVLWVLNYHTLSFLLLLILTGAAGTGIYFFGRSLV